MQPVNLALAAGIKSTPEKGVRDLEEFQQTAEKAENGQGSVGLRSEAAWVRTGNLSAAFGQYCVAGGDNRPKGSDAWESPSVRGEAQSGVMLEMVGESGEVPERGMCEEGRLPPWEGRDEIVPGVVLE